MLNKGFCMDVSPTLTLLALEEELAIEASCSCGSCANISLIMGFYTRIFCFMSMNFLFYLRVLMC